MARYDAGPRKYTTVRIPYDLYIDVRTYATWHRTSISKVLEGVLRDYVADARERLSQGKMLADGLRSRRSSRMVFLVCWHGDEKLARDLHLLTAADGTTIRNVVENRLRQKVGGFAEKIRSGGPTAPAAAPSGAG